MPGPDRAVVVMGKVPRPGRVKTRLTPAVSPEVASRLYTAFLLDVFDAVDRARETLGLTPVFACAVEDEADRAAGRSLCPNGWRFVEQRGPGLGMRIAAAREDAGADHVVIVGSDAPTMPHERFSEAFAALSRVPAVFGPTEDGGYYLIGLTGRYPALLDRIPWSTAEVMAKTREAAARAGIRIEELPVGYDIDRVEDLVRARNDASRVGATRTRAAIEAALPSQTW